MWREGGSEAPGGDGQDGEDSPPISTLGEFSWPVTPLSGPYHLVLPLPLPRTTSPGSVAFSEPSAVPEF